MFDKQAIETLQEGQAITAANQETAINDTADLVALPTHYTLHDLEHLQATRRRARGTMSTRLIAPFAQYTQMHAETGAAVFVDAQDLKASAVLNLGDAETPGQADNLATLSLQRTAAYSALVAITSSARSQTEVAEFLEDWAPHLTCLNDEGEIKRPLAIAAVRKITIDSSRKLESEEQQLGATRSAFESVQASSKDPLPTTIHFKCQPYADLRERDFVLRLGILTGDSKPKITLRIQKAELHAEEMALELVGLLTQALPADLPVLVGQYSKGR